MTKKLRIWILVLLAAVLLIPASVSASDLHDDKVIFGGNYTLESGETLNGDLVAFGGNVEIAKQAQVNGDVAVMGGNLTTAGTINGDLVGMGGFVTLEETAVVSGNLTIIGSSVDQKAGAKITGNIVTEESFPFEFTLPPQASFLNGDLPHMRFWGAPFLSAGWFFFQLLIWAGLAVILVLFLEDNANRIKNTALQDPGITFLTGLGIALIAPVVLLILTITILLIPVSFIGIFLLIFAWMVGWVALSLEVGRRLGAAFNQEWPAPINAGIGIFITLLMFNGFQKIVPCVGFLPKTIVGLWMLGAVILTRFGTKDYPDQPHTQGVPAATSLPESEPIPDPDPEPAPPSQEKEQDDPEDHPA